MAIGYTLLNIDKDGTPSTKLGPKMGMEPRSLTRMIKSLETKGWIEKRIDKNDKRMVNIYLTKTGITMRNRTRNSVIKFNKTIQEKINQSELKTCFKVLNEINTLIDNKEIFKL
jgi:DNA-binding MarR family transcriptional regulator